jgi:NTE family protein
MPRSGTQKISNNILLRIGCLVLFLLFFIENSYSQKVGLVLSGGGASGIAHIGVIKALEENHIPIDYIAGTSMGAFIGALYAAGYTPQQMEDLVTSPDFQRIATGEISAKFIYYFKQKIPEASWITFRFSLDTSIITSIPTHLISPVPVDFAMMQYFTAPSSAAHNSFDSLFIPFRCVAADIVAKKPYIFKDGNLGQAIRASISYPFYLKPIVVDGRMLFDGGLYNNFPTNVMHDEFHPDIVLGSNVSGNIEAPSEDNILSEIKNMLMTQTNYKIDSNGMIIAPDVEAGILTAPHPKSLIDSGYNATMRQIPTILKMIKRRSDPAQIAQRRMAFLAKQHPLLFKSLILHGLNSAQERYIRSVLMGNKTALSVSEMEKNYYKVATDDDIHSIYPLANYIDTAGYYNLDATVKKEKHFSGSFGGVISNRPISEGYVSLEYNHVGRQEIDIFANTYFGKLYTSVLVAPKIYFPSALPFYIEPFIIYNRWDYFTSSTEFFEDIQPAYLIQREVYGRLDIGVPIGMRAKMIIGLGRNNMNNTYYQSIHFAPTDTADQTNFNANFVYLRYEMNTLNRKEYASAGTRIFFQAEYLNGEEFFYPGSLQSVKDTVVQRHDWGQIKLSIDNYYKQRGILRLGIYAEAVYTNSLVPVASLQTKFTDYYATALMAPAFQPSPESLTLFLPNYRAFNYLAGGPKLIVSFKPNIDLRFEGYIFLPYQAINDVNNLAVYSKPFASRHYIGVASIVYNSPIGPVGLSLNYFDSDPINSFSILFHIGFLIFNEKSIN